MGSFKCVKCGNCCKRLSINTALGERGVKLFSAHYGYKVETIQVLIAHRCKLLSRDNLCMDYKNRPPFCREHQCDTPGQLVIEVKEGGDKG